MLSLRSLRLVAFALTAMLAAFAAAAPQQPAVARGDLQTLALSSDLRIRMVGGRMIELEVRVAEGDDFAAVASRVARSSREAEAIEVWNGGRPVTVGDWVRVPLPLLSDEYRVLTLTTVFPEDRWDGEDWLHIARAGKLPVYDEGLWQVAEWFTGRGDRFRQLMDVNGLSSPELRSRQPVRVPGALLHGAFRAGEHSDDGTLTYASDEQGPFAGYRLRPGEALYSAVVVRFTGRTAAEDVTEIARRIGERSGIRDLRDIPAGFRIKIPFDLLEPQYLPAGHPQRLEAEAARRELEQALASEPVATSRRGLEGVLVILDPGHGGKDLGTMNHGIWEHDYVYDVSCRLKQLLETRTAARVVMTLEDAQTGCLPSKGDRLKANRQGTILTQPPFLVKQDGESRMGVNLRWYLANSIYRKAVAAGTDPERIVFLSLHADSRLASLRGVMVYVPGAKYCAKTHGFKSKSYARFAEVREKPFVSFSYKERVRSEAVSKKLADRVVESFRKAGLPVQSYQPVRNRIVRGRQIYAPAVLRGNAVPTKVLIEMVNLSNTDDAALLAGAQGRTRMAEAILDSLTSHLAR